MNLMCSEQVILGDECDSVLGSGSGSSSAAPFRHHLHHHHPHHYHPYLQPHSHHHGQQQQHLDHMYDQPQQQQPHYMLSDATQTQLYAAASLDGQNNFHTHQPLSPPASSRSSNAGSITSSSCSSSSSSSLSSSSSTSSQHATASGSSSSFGNASLMQYAQSEPPRLNIARPDPIFLDDRCLQNLLLTEDKAEGTEADADGEGSYFAAQKDITPAMRKIVAEWMMEVCEENKCQEEVFLLALSYMDRFLAITSVRKTHLQILAAACLLLASKLREPSCLGLPAGLLVFYTDNSITRTDLIHWELCVLSALKWEISTVTPLDFLELLLIRLPIENKKCPDVNPDKIRKHAQAFISLAAREHNFYMFSPSTIAAASIAASLNGMNWHMRTGIQYGDLLQRLIALIGVKENYLRTCVDQMEALFDQQLQQQRLIPSYLISITAQNIPATTSSAAAASNASPDDVSALLSPAASSSSPSPTETNASPASPSGALLVPATPNGERRCEAGSPSSNCPPSPHTMLPFDAPPNRDSTAAAETTAASRGEF